MSSPGFFIVLTRQAEYVEGLKGKSSYFTKVSSPVFVNLLSAYLDYHHQEVDSSIARNISVPDEQNQKWADEYICHTAVRGVSTHIRGMEKNKQNGQTILRYAVKGKVLHHELVYDGFDDSTAYSLIMIYDGITGNSGSAIPQPDRTEGPVRQPEPQVLVARS